VLGEVWGSLFEIDHGTGVHKWIVWKAFAGTKGHTLVRVEGTGEFVAVVDVENAVVEVDVHADIQVSPGVGLNGTRLGNKVALEENALRDTRVGDACLQNVDGIVLKVVIHSALTEAVILVLVLNDGLLEVDGEVEYLTIVFKPLWSHSGNGIILLNWSLGASQGWGTTLLHAL